MRKLCPGPQAPLRGGSNRIRGETNRFGIAKVGFDRCDHCTHFDGDQFDAVVGYARWLAHLGDKAYDVALYVNRVFNAVRK